MTTSAKRAAARQRYHREAETICPICDGKGRILSASVRTRARQGGNASYLKSLQPGGMSMKERGKRGGGPRALTIDDIRRMDREGLTAQDIEKEHRLNRVNQGRLTKGR